MTEGLELAIDKMNGLKLLCLLFPDLKSHVEAAQEVCDSMQTACDALRVQNNAGCCAEAREHIDVLTEMRNELERTASQHFTFAEVGKFRARMVAYNHVIALLRRVSK